MLGVEPVYDALSTYLSLWPSPPSLSLIKQKKREIHFLLTSRWEPEQLIGKRERYTHICTLSFQNSSHELLQDTYLAISRISVPEYTCDV